MLMPFSRDGAADMFWPEPFNLTDAVASCRDQWGVQVNPDPRQRLLYYNYYHHARRPLPYLTDTPSPPLPPSLSDMDPPRHHAPSKSFNAHLNTDAAAARDGRVGRPPHRRRRQHRLLQWPAGPVARRRRAV